MSAADPLNLVGTLLPGDKVPAVAGNRRAVSRRRGGGAVIAGKTRYLLEFDGAEREAVRLRLVKRSARGMAAGARGGIAYTV